MSELACSSFSIHCKFSLNHCSLSAERRINYITAKGGANRHSKIVENSDQLKKSFLTRRMTMTTISPPPPNCPYATDTQRGFLNFPLLRVIQHTSDPTQPSKSSSSPSIRHHKPTISYALCQRSHGRRKCNHPAPLRLQKQAPSCQQKNNGNTASNKIKTDKYLIAN